MAGGRACSPSHLEVATKRLVVNCSQRSGGPSPVPLEAPMTDILLDTPLEDLRARCTGEVLTPNDEAYADAARAWNIRYSHRPAVIVMAETSEDVAEAVRHARAHDLKIAVQSSGHGFARVADGAVLVNLSRLTAFRVDAHARTARVSGGTKWWPVLEAAAAVGLAPLLGSTPDVGAVGYTLGG